MTGEEFLKYLEQLFAPEIQLSVFICVLFVLTYGLACYLLGGRRKCSKLVPTDIESVVIYTLYNTEPKYVRQLLVQAYKGPPLYIPPLHTYVTISGTDYFVRGVYFVAEDHSYEVRVEEAKKS